MAFGALEILTNTAYERLRTIDIASSALVSRAEVRSINAVWGQAWLTAPKVSGDDLLTYSTLGESLSVDRFVVTRADRHVGNVFGIATWAPYPTLAGQIVYSPFSEPLIGRSQRDFVFGSVVGLGAPSDGEPVTGLDAVSLIGYGSLVFDTFCPSLSIRFDVISPGSLSRSPLARFSRITRGKIPYEVDQAIEITFLQVPQATVDRLDDAWSIREMPFYMYDRTGAVFPEKLIECVLVNMPSVYAYDNGYTVTIRAARTREYLV